MKKYVLFLSPFFMNGHKRQGEPTGFIDKLYATFCTTADEWIGKSELNVSANPQKIHTIRASVRERLFADVTKGGAYLSIRSWEGKPYRSKQKEVIRLYQENYVALQPIKMTYDSNDPLPRVWIEGKEVSLPEVAQNDGLTVPDFIDWFFGNGKSNVFEGYVIHFTEFRY